MRLKNTHRFFAFLFLFIFSSSPLSFGKILRLRRPRIVNPQGQRFSNSNRLRQSSSNQAAPIRNTPIPAAPRQSSITNSHTETEPQNDSRHTINPSPTLRENETSPRPQATNTADSESAKRPFGRDLAEAFKNRPRLFQQKTDKLSADPYVKIFCENPYQLVCETPMDDVPAETWPNSIFPRNVQGAFATGKRILGFLNDHHFDFDDANKKAIHNQLEQTQVLVSRIGGPTAFGSTPPRIEIPNTGYWNLFSVFHELGHIIDFRTPFPINRGEVIQLVRNTNSISNIDAIEKQISEKEAEIKADKIAAKGFAFLGDPHIKRLGFEPMSRLSLIKTLKTAAGFLCSSPGSPEHPSGKFRINYIGTDQDLRTVLGCPATK